MPTLPTPVSVTEMNEALMLSGLRQHELRREMGMAIVESQTLNSAHLVTEAALRDANLKLREATDIAERANKAKDNFLAALSHELRTPLTPVLFAVGALCEDRRLPADVREQLCMVERNVALEARLIDDLLDLTKLSTGKLHLRAEACDAHSLIGLAIEIVQDEAREKGITISRIFTAAKSGLIADPARFQQVIWNLLRNAVKFTPNGGSISVRTANEGQVPAVSLRIEVTDTGIGIDAANLEQIFLPLNQGSLTGDHRFGGIGLGLAIARAVVLLHGGTIRAESRGTNLGSTFLVDLPGAIELLPGFTDTSHPFPPKGVAPHRKQESLRLLLVEDHVSSLRTLQHLMQRDGHTVVAAANVAEALAAAAGNTFDLVISDLGLPDGSGLELMEKLRTNYRLRGIALSGYGRAEDFARSSDAGFIAHLIKPVPIAELRRVLAALSPPDDAPGLT